MTLREPARDVASGLISGSKVRVLEAAGLRVVWAEDLEAIEQRAAADVARLLQASIELNELRRRAGGRGR